MPIGAFYEVMSFVQVMMQNSIWKSTEWRQIAFCRFNKRIVSFHLIFSIELENWLNRFSMKTLLMYSKKYITNLINLFFQENDEAGEIFAKRKRSVLPVNYRSSKKVKLCPKVVEKINLTIDENPAQPLVLPLQNANRLVLITSKSKRFVIIN